MGDNFNENLKIARERKGISQKDLAERIGVAKSTYSLYESGNREPNVQTIKKIADNTIINFSPIFEEIESSSFLFCKNKKMPCFNVKPIP